MNRREFLAAAAVATYRPVLLGMTRRPRPNPVIGTGEHKYQCFHNWGELPADYAWQTTHNVALDSAGLVYITHQGIGKQKGMDTVFVFDPKGKFVRSFGKEWHGGGHGIEIRKEGGEEFIYLSNTWTPAQAGEDEPQGRGGVGEGPAGVQGVRPGPTRRTRPRRGPLTTRPTSAGCRTAGSTSATGTARTTCSTTTRTASW